MSVPILSCLVGTVRADVPRVLVACTLYNMNDRKHEGPDSEGQDTGSQMLWLSLMGGVLVVLGTFLPWIQVGSIIVNRGMDNPDGAIALVGGGVACVVCIFCLVERNHSRRLWPPACLVLLAALALGVSLLDLQAVESRIAGLSGGFLSIAASVGSGLYVILAGAIALGVGGVGSWLAVQGHISGTRPALLFGVSTDKATTTPAKVVTASPREWRVRNRPLLRSVVAATASKKRLVVIAASAALAVALLLVALNLAGVLPWFSSKSSSTGSPRMSDETWSAEPGRYKTQFAVKGASDGISATVRVFRLTPEFFASSGETSIEDARRLIANGSTVLFGGRETVIVWVEVSSNGEFRPTDLCFVQGAFQNDVGASDFKALVGPFSGRLVAGTVSVGMVALPKGIDLAHPFSVYYGGVRRGQLGPFSEGPAS